MNKLVLNEKGRNHIKILPLKDMTLPETNKEKLELCESIYNSLRDRNDAKRLSIYKNSKRGVMITVWSMDDNYYLIQSLRDPGNLYYINTIYMSHEKDDLLSIAKFLQKSLTTIGSDYKKQLLDARDALVKETLENEKAGEA